MKTGRIFPALALSVAVAGVAGNVNAQDPGTHVAEADDWQAVVFEETATNPRTCSAVTAPMKSVYMRDGREVSPGEISRDAAILFVTYVPSRNGTVEVSFGGGYPFAKGSTATLQIGDATFELLTHSAHSDDEEYVWAKLGEDKTIVTAMKRGAEAVLTARSHIGTRVQDTFSLIGATAMIEEAERRCGS